MQRSPERYLLYFILIGALGSMLLIYGLAAWNVQREIGATALALSIILIGLGIGILVQRMNKK